MSSLVIAAGSAPASMLASLAAVAAGLVFAASLVSKLRTRRSWRDYRSSIRASRAVPGSLAEVAAGLLAVAEAAVVLLLLWPAHRPAGLTAAAGLALILTVGVAISLGRGSQASCACFGAGQRLSGQHLIRNLSLTAVLALGAGCADLAGAEAHAAAGWLAVATAALFGLAVATVIVGWEDLLWSLGVLVGTPS